MDLTNEEEQRKNKDAAGKSRAERIIDLKWMCFVFISS